MMLFSNPASLFVCKELEKLKALKIRLSGGQGTFVSGV